jgi:predicted NBD/HSP70 family sugar kinase
VAGVSVAVPGLVDVDAGLLALAPNLGWREVPLLAELAARLQRPDLHLQVDNDANLAAVAEHALGCARGVGDLVYLTGEVGVGAGVILGGHLVRGAAGYTGEVGHMPIGSGGHSCGCGRVGCWETQVGLAALLEEVADPDDPVRDERRDLQGRLLEVRSRADRGDPRTVAGLEKIGRDLGLGASILVNLVNPAVIVLGGYFAVLGTHMIETARAELRARVIAPDAGRCRLELSTLGFSASILGGAHLALSAVLTDPTLVPHLDMSAAVETLV